MERVGAAAMSVDATLRKLRPTQMTLGLAEVLLKRQQWRALGRNERHTFLAAHPIPTVQGPKQRQYIIDHHHLGRALLDEGLETVPLRIVADLSVLQKDEFWLVMDHRQWLHPFDARGHRRKFAELPRTLAAMTDDPYRSLAAAVRIDGGFAKEMTPFAEFLWADFLRRRVSAKLLKSDPSAALAVALQIAHNRAASHLPGWTADSPQKVRDLASP